MAIHQLSQIHFRVTWKGLLRFILGWAACVILAAVLLAALALLTSFSIWFTAVTTGRAYYPTPDAALQAKIDQVFTGVQRYEVRAMGPNDYSGRHPGVWFVGAEVWTADRSDGREVSVRGHDSIGQFLVLTKRGWVFIGEAGWPSLWGSPAD